jgi:hypothetical protein
VFGGETWAMAEMDMTRLCTWKRKILRRIYGPVVEQGLWRIRTDQEMTEVYKDLDVLVGIKKKRFLNRLDM